MDYRCIYQETLVIFAKEIAFKEGNVSALVFTFLYSSWFAMVNFINNNNNNDNEKFIINYLVLKQLCYCTMLPDTEFSAQVPCVVFTCILSLIYPLQFDSCVLVVK